VYITRRHVLLLIVLQHVLGFLFAFVSVFLLLLTIFSNPCRYVFNGFVPMTTHMDFHQSLHWSVLVNGTKHLKHERGSRSRARLLMSDGIDYMFVFHGSNFQSYTTGQTGRTICATTFCGNRGYSTKRCFRHLVQERPQADMQELLPVKIDMLCIARPIFL